MKINHIKFFLGALTGLLTAVSPTFAQDWTQTSAPNDNFTSIACSADGVKLVAVSYNTGVNGYYIFDYGEIYTSTNSGNTWNLTTSGQGGWKSVASSADGTRLVAANTTWDGTVYNNTIYTSTNSG